MKQLPFCDLGSFRVLEWLLFFVGRGRLWLLHTAALCTTTFSIARQPHFRSKAKPEGFDLRESKTKLGNLILLRTMAVLLAIGRLTPFHGSHEHPKSAYSWQWDKIKRLFEIVGCEILWLSMCSFAAPFRKDTRLGLVRALFLRPLAKPCSGFHSHVRLSGILCSQAARYPDGFAQEYTACAYAAFMTEAPALGQDDIEHARANSSGGFELVCLTK